MIGKPTVLTPRASAHLDMIRGLAALQVMVGHVRGLFLVDYPDLSAHPALIAALYGATGFGHEAVIVFFVLSGYFVGGSALGSIRRFSWTRYLANRLTRLYLVLVPALILAAVLDYFAIRQPGGPLYFDFPIKHFTTYPIPGRDSLVVFFGNILFLQNIFVSTFGSAMPLQTVGMEFWYYVLFPALALVVYSAGSARRRIVGALISVILLARLPQVVISGFPVWLLGAGVDALPSFLPKRGVRLALTAVSWTLFAAALALSRTLKIRGESGDVILGFTFALVLSCLTKLTGGPSVAPTAYAWLAKTVSKCSYSVYAVHFPIAMLVRTALGATLFLPTAWNLAMGTAFTSGIFLFGLLFSRFTEAYTDPVRAKVWRVLGLV